MLTSQNKLGQVVGKGNRASIANTVLADPMLMFAFFYKVQCSMFNQKGCEDALLIEDCLSIQRHFMSLPALFLVGKASC